MAGRRDIKAGKAYVSMYVRNKGLISGLRKASTSLRAFGAGMQSIGIKMMAMGGAITAPLLLATKRFMSMGDEVAKMSIRVGLGVRALSELGFAAEQSGSNIEQLGTALFRMIRRIANASTGIGPAARALKKLGLTAKDLTRLSPEKQFYTITDALAGVKNESLAAQYAFEVFGLGARSLLPLLREGTAGMDKLRKEARELGRSISPEDAKAAAALTDAWNRLMSTLKGATFQIGSALASSLEISYDKITEQFKAVVEWIKNNKGLIVSLFKLGTRLTAVGAALAIVGTGIVGIGVVVGSAATIVTALGTAFGIATAAIGAILSPISLVTAAVAGLVAYFLWASGSITGVLDWLKNGFDILKDEALAAFGGISDAMAAGDMKLAAKILWGYLKTVWQRGLTVLKGLWDGFKSFWSDGIQGLALLFIGLVGKIQLAWVGMIDFLKKSWEEFKKSGARSAAAGWLAKRELMSEGMSEEEADKKIAAVKKTIEKRSDRRKQTIEAETDARQKAIKKSTRETQDQIGEDIRRRKEKEKTAGAAAQAELDAAKKELDDLVAKAKDKREQKELREGKPGKTEAPGMPSAPSLGGTAVGTFSAQQSLLLGGGTSVQERTYQEIKKSGKTYREMLDYNRKIYLNTKRWIITATR